MEVQLPFSGFYESKWSGGVDNAHDQQAEWYADNKTLGDFTAAEINDAMYLTTDYDWQGLAKDYAEAMARELDDAAGWPLRLRYAAIQSPKFYNFETDRIFMSVPRATVRRMRKETTEATLTQVATDRHTSRSGFHSFYSPDWRSWGNVDSWDHNLLCTLLIAWCVSREIDLDALDWSIYENFSGNGTFDDVLTINEAKLREVLKEKEHAGA